MSAPFLYRNDQVWVVKNFICVNWKVLCTTRGRVSPGSVASVPSDGRLLSPFMVNLFWPLAHGP
jgi:hypothetical protein